MSASAYLLIYHLDFQLNARQLHQSHLSKHLACTLNNPIALPSFKVVNLWLGLPNKHGLIVENEVMWGIDDLFWSVSICLHKAMDLPRNEYAILSRQLHWDHGPLRELVKKFLGKLKTFRSHFSWCVILPWHMFHFLNRFEKGNVVRCIPPSGAVSA